MGFWYHCSFWFLMLLWPREVPRVLVDLVVEAVEYTDLTEPT